LLGPLGTLLLGGVTLGDILALLLLDSLTLDHIILHIVLMEPGLALGLVDSLTLNGALTIADEWGVTELNLLLGGDGLVLNEAVLPEVLLALLFLLRLEVGGVGGVALLGVAMLALNDIVILGLLNHHDLIDTPLTGSGNRSNVQGDIITATLTGATGGQGSLWCVGSMISVVIMMSVLGGGTSIGLVKGESSPQVLALSVRSSC